MNNLIWILPLVFALIIIIMFIFTLNIMMRVRKREGLDLSKPKYAIGDILEWDDLRIRNNIINNKEDEDSRVVVLNVHTHLFFVYQYTVQRIGEYKTDRKFKVYQHNLGRGSEDE